MISVGGIEIYPRSVVFARVPLDTLAGGDASRARARNRDCLEIVVGDQILGEHADSKLRKLGRDGQVDFAGLEGYRAHRGGHGTAVTPRRHHAGRHQPVAS